MEKQPVKKQKTNEKYYTEELDYRKIIEYQKKKKKK